MRFFARLSRTAFPGCPSAARVNLVGDGRQPYTSRHASIL